MFNHAELQQFNAALAKSVLALMDKWQVKYRAKDENYSASWLLTGETLHLWFGNIMLDTPQKHVIYGLVTRMLDKIIRGSNLELKRERDKVGETAQETFADLGVYGFLTAMATQISNLEEGLGGVTNPSPTQPPSSRWACRKQEQEV